MTTLEKIYTHFCESNFRLTTDSRKVTAGIVYLALKGERFDGNEFANQALKSGASLVVIDNEEYDSKDDRVILVEDSLATLQLLATHHRLALNLPVIALTGSNGKTTTKELLHAALSTKYKVLATAGNFNNHIGVPLTILSATPEHELMLVEMGANHVGEIHDLCNIALPDVGLITNIGKAHLEGFGGYEGVIKAKSEMYHYLKSTGGTIVYNHDDELLTSLVDDYVPSVLYAPSRDYELIDSYPRLSFTYKGTGYISHLVGAYNLTNIATAVGVGALMQCEVNEMLQAICLYEPSNNRSQTITKKGVHFILDAYNANPTSMELAIKEFGESSFSNKVMVLGDMMELGEDAIAEHERTIDQCLMLNKVEVVFVGPIFKSLENKYPHLNFVTSVNDLQSFISCSTSGTHCFVKGSRAIKLENVLGFLD